MRITKILQRLLIGIVLLSAPGTVAAQDMQTLQTLQMLQMMGYQIDPHAMGEMIMGPEAYGERVSYLTNWNGATPLGPFSHFNPMMAMRNLPPFTGPYTPPIGSNSISAALHYGDYHSYALEAL